MFNSLIGIVLVSSKFQSLVDVPGMFFGGGIRRSGRRDVTLPFFLERVFLSLASS